MRSTILFTLLLPFVLVGCTSIGSTIELQRTDGDNQPVVDGAGPYGAVVQRIDSASNTFVALYFDMPRPSDYSAFAAYWITPGGEALRLGGFDMDNAHLGQGDGVVSVRAGPLHFASPDAGGLEPGEAGGIVEVNETEGWVVAIWGNVTNVTITVTTDGTLSEPSFAETRALEISDWEGGVGLGTPPLNVHVARTWGAPGPALFGYVKVYRPWDSKGEVVCTHSGGSTRVSLDGPTPDTTSLPIVLDLDDERWLFSLPGPMSCVADQRASVGAKIYLTYAVLPEGLLPPIDQRFENELEH